jgi:hypothetical protein
VLRRVARELSLRRRFDRLTARDFVRSEKLKKVLLFLAFKLGRCRDQEEKAKQQMIFRAVCAQYFSLVYHERKPLDRPLRLNRTIDSFSESDCYIFFRFTKPHLRSLVNLLQLHDESTFDNNEKMKGEEILLRALYELVSGETKHKIARNVFGRDASSQSRAFSYFIEHMYDTFLHIVRGNMKWWYNNGFFASSAKAIGAKLDLEVGNLVSHFIDCNCLETERVGGGSAEAGANAARWDPHIQRAFYNGWKSMNGLKHQTVDDAYCDSVEVIVRRENG